ncbi:N-acetylglucosaminyl-phosphatidylinositol de-N-acetylase-like, partial [Culicoides brevitarsis]|uniref:N-acetylglucosaminyl-phosphatidylinositol de-N-acetylase-like n=1 Tax=Culicoides brevitarsis TaxID=469753 RepID=UPI00307CA444
KETLSVLEHLAILCFIYTFGCFVSYWLISSRKSWKLSTLLPRTRRVLVVTAHPDDESMFFAPTILGLREQKCRVFLLCLSNGNFDKKGRQRRSELFAACEILTLDQSDVTLLNATNLQDDPNLEWKNDFIAKIVLKHVEALDIETIITFDREGVSHHPNHCAIFYAVASLWMSNALPKNCKVFILESVSVLRKYLSLLDLPMSLFTAKKWSFLSWKKYRKAQTAMCQHKSQLLWFRRLYIIFSRYMVINTLRELDINVEALENAS